MELTPIFKLLSDETRLRVILLLSKEELCVCEICGVLDESQPKISKVLSKLRDLDLVSDKRIEKFVFYKVKDTNGLLNNTLMYILENLDSYPILVSDQQRLAHKTEYLNRCSLDLLEEIS
ncbi:metalloregulator ArsR/SmtB family transcription factor [Clostridia bacterium]|nr:metalloregulator ArsR/SmtB family transcription factor [Clostridia bacterium]